jgi:hypothetical protein
MTLIEKLEAQRNVPGEHGLSERGAGFNDGIDDAIAIVHQHQANCTLSPESKICGEHNVVASEIPVSRDLLLAAIHSDIEAELVEYHPAAFIIENAAKSVMGTIEPFLAKREPVSVASYMGDASARKDEGRIGTTARQPAASLDTTSPATDQPEAIAAATMREMHNAMEPVAEQPDDCKAAFEAWASQPGMLLPLAIDDALGRYKSEETYLLWAGWRASWQAKPERESVLAECVGLRDLKSPDVLVVFRAPDGTTWDPGASYEIRRKA